MEEACGVVDFFLLRISSSKIRGEVARKDLPLWGLLLFMLRAMKQAVDVSRVLESLTRDSRKE